jgi:hypothetical protein
MRRRSGLLAFLLCAAVTAAAQTPQNATLKRAVQAYDNLDLNSAISLAHQALGQRMVASDQDRAYSLLGFAYSNTTEGFDKAIDAFKQVLLIAPERALDANRTPTKTLVAFNMALSTMLLVRGLGVDSARFVAGAGIVPIHFSVTSPARVRTRAVSGKTVVLVDSAIANGSVNLRWPATMANGDPVPPGDYTIVVEATAGENSFSASRRVRVASGAVDTVAHLLELPGYAALPEMEVPPRSWRPMGLAFLYTGIAGAGSLALENSSLGTPSRRELLAVSAGALITGFVMMLKKPSAQPARGNILYNRLLQEQLVRRNADIAQENVQRRRQVELTITPIADPAR